MPTNVNVPPKIAANERGISNLPGLTTLLFFIVEMSDATTAVLLINADENAVPTRVLKVDEKAEPLIIAADNRLNTLVRSKAKEHKTNKTKVTRPEFIALLNTSSYEINEKPRQTNMTTENIRSGTCWYFIRPIWVAINITTINHWGAAIKMSLLIVNYKVVST